MSKDFFLIIILKYIQPQSDLNKIENNKTTLLYLIMFKKKNEKVGRKIVYYEECCYKNVKYM